MIAPRCTDPNSTNHIEYLVSFTLQVRSLARSMRPEKHLLTTHKVQETVRHSMQATSRQALGKIKKPPLHLRPRITIRSSPPNQGLPATTRQPLATAMCMFMAAHHFPCKHIHQWFARCYFAKWANTPRCNMSFFPTWQYVERFSCPECLRAAREEAAQDVRRWSSA